MALHGDAALHDLGNAVFGSCRFPARLPHDSSLPAAAPLRIITHTSCRRSWPLGSGWLPAGSCWCIFSGAVRRRTSCSVTIARPACKIDGCKLIQTEKGRSTRAKGSRAMAQRSQEKVSVDGIWYVYLL